MTTDEVIEHYGGVRALALALGVTTQTIYAWGRYPPIGRQFQLELATKGKLRAGTASDQRKAAHG